MDAVILRWSWHSALVVRKLSDRLKEARYYLNAILKQRDPALGRLKKFVEE